MTQSPEPTASDIAAMAERLCKAARFIEQWNNTSSPERHGAIQQEAIDLQPFLVTAATMLDRLAASADVRAQTIEQCARLAEGYSVGAFTGWDGKTGQSKITLDEAEEHSSECFLELRDAIRALPAVSANKPLEPSS